MACEEKNTTEDDNIPLDLLKELGNSGLNIITVLVKKICMYGDWLGFSRCYDDDITKEKWSNHRKISLISHNGKIVAE